jgi:hypothetical protein
MTIDNLPKKDNVLKKYKLYLIDPINYHFPEYSLCKKIFGNLGELKYDEDIFINDKYMYKLITKNGGLGLSYDNIWIFFEKEIGMKDDWYIHYIIKLYFEIEYNGEYVYPLAINFGEEW